MRLFSSEGNFGLMIGMVYILIMFACDVIVNAIEQGNIQYKCKNNGNGISNCAGAEDSFQNEIGRVVTADEEHIIAHHAITCGKGKIHNI